ncbi:Alpha/Beta hydrolase protein [Nemania abortiva]|nr:Alpha/Beta hydrolase protein [Nemania abortiva]
MLHVLHPRFEPDPSGQPGSKPLERTSPTMDIVAVHGLNGHYMDTWTDKSRHGSGTMWLRDLLPEELHGCRVMTYQYDASVTSMSVGRVRDAAGNLLRLLNDSREDPIYANVPIVFVGHSLGGIVIKQAVVFSQDKTKLKYVANDIKGMVFFGTPHRGSDAANWASLAKRIGRVVVPGSKRGLLEMLKTHSEGLYNVNEDFRPLSTNYAIVSFYEEYAYRIWGKVVVDKDSAVMGLPHEEEMMLSGTHTSMCRFSEGDKQFDAVWRRIRDVAAGP